MSNEPINTMQGVTHADLLDLARELDRFSRRFERFCLVQLEQLDISIQNFERQKQQWERQRTRDLKQIQENSRALQEAWAELKEGNKLAADIEAPELSTGDEEIDQQALLKSAGDPLQLLVRPGTGGEMLIGQLLLSLSRLHRAHGGCGVRFELAECYEKSNGDVLLEVQLFPTRPLQTIQEGELSDDVIKWQKFKSALALLPLGRGLEEVAKSGEPGSRDHETAQMFLSAARRAEDGDSRTASAVKRGIKGVREYSAQLTDLFERHRDDGLALQPINS